MEYDCCRSLIVMVGCLTGRQIAVDVSGYRLEKEGVQKGKRRLQLLKVQVKAYRGCGSRMCQVNRES